MYDEAIEIGDSDYEEESEYTSTVRKPGVSPIRKRNPQQLSGSSGAINRIGPVPSTAANFDYYSQNRHFNMDNDEMLPPRPKTLSSKDFISATARPTSSNQRVIGANNPLARLGTAGGGGGDKQGTFPDRGLSSSSEFSKLKMADLQKAGSSDDDPNLARKSSSSKPRPLSASQRRSPPSDDEDDDDDDEDYDEDLNVAQIEGILREYNSKRNKPSRGILSGCSDTSSDDDDNVLSELFDDSVFEDIPASPDFIHDDYGMIIDNALVRVPPPQDSYPCPPIHDDEEMLEYFRHKKLWELQMDMKREQIGQKVRMTDDLHGIHDYCNPIYKPEDYASLNVTPEIKEIFGYITQYTLPQMNSQIDVKLQPFIPEYYPAVGDIDAFIKVIDPGVKEDGLGIKCLDEPAPFQSDPSVLDLRLRALAKQSSAKAVVVKKVENVGKNTKVIDNWIKDISDLHRSKPSPSVHYSKPMPDIDLLIQEWPPEVEELMKNVTLPSPDLNCDLATYADIVCNLLDIPVYKSRIHSLHVLFTLYATQKQFSQYGPLGGGGSNGNEADLMPSSTSLLRNGEEVDHLQIS